MPKICTKCLQGYTFLKSCLVYYVWRHQRAVTHVWRHYDYDRGSFAVIPPYDRMRWTHWDRVTHICVSKLFNIDSDKGLSHGWHQAVILTNAGILLIRNLGTNCSETLSKIRAFSFNKMHLKMSSAKWRQFFLGLNVLTHFVVGENLYLFSVHQKVQLLCNVINLFIQI